MTLLYTRTLPLLPHEDLPVTSRPWHISDVTLTNTGLTQCVCFIDTDDDDDVVFIQRIQRIKERKLY